MCLRCGVVEYPYRSWPSGPAGPGDYGSPPDASPPEDGAAPTGGFFGIGARGRDYRMATGWWDRGRAVGGNILTRLRISREPPVDHQRPFLRGHRHGLRRAASAVPQATRGRRWRGIL